ncbi:uncharacterized protein LOC127285560 [Leptopilina boulardi]|uniref:uncharacterized protein LOC127285560 n=1 Tax=Leptopilina boulardi TaxID=63433 RepID=UPI0021F604DC|nr:uncharacterized protein LOC127285560 [Leptopilina boulardi]
MSKMYLLNLSICGRKNIILCILIACITYCQAHINSEGRKISIINFDPEHRNLPQYNSYFNARSKTRITVRDDKSTFRKYFDFSSRYVTRDAAFILIKTNQLPYYQVRVFYNQRKLPSDNIIIYNEVKKFRRSKKARILQRLRETNDERLIHKIYPMYLRFYQPIQERRHFRRSNNRKIRFTASQTLQSDTILKYTERFLKFRLNYKRFAREQYNNNFSQQRFRLNYRLHDNVESYIFKILREVQFNSKELFRVQSINPLIPETSFPSLKYGVNQFNLNKNKLVINKYNFEETENTEIMRHYKQLNHNTLPQYFIRFDTYFTNRQMNIAFNFVKHVFTELNKNALHVEDKYFFLKFGFSKQFQKLIQITGLKKSMRKNEFIVLGEKDNRIQKLRSKVKYLESDLCNRKDTERKEIQDITFSDQRQILFYRSSQKRQIFENSFRRENTVITKQVVRNKVLITDTNRIRNLNRVKGFINFELKVRLLERKFRTFNIRTSNAIPFGQRNLSYAFQSNNLKKKLILNKTNLFTEAIRHIFLICLCALHASANLGKKSTFLRSTKHQLQSLTGV